MSPFAVVPGFAGPTNLLDPINVDIERTINWYPESSVPGSPKAPLVLRRTPGTVSFMTVATSPVRSLLFQDDHAGMVAGNTFYGFQSDGTATSHGIVAVDDYPATQSLAATQNVDPPRSQDFITSGGQGYVYNVLTNTFSAITDPDFLLPSRMGLYLDGFFFNLKGESRLFQFSDEIDAFNWDGLNILERSIGSDNIVCIATAHRELWVLGSQTSEVWVNTGNPDNPFEPINGVFINIGCCAPFATRMYDNSLIWVGYDRYGVGIVYKANGYTPQRISTTAVERALQQADFRETLRFAQAFVYQFQGHLFYVLYVPGNETTWVYDASTGLWSEWAQYNDETPNAFSPHRATTQCFAFGMQLVGDRLTGGVYELSHDQLQDEVVALA